LALCGATYTLATTKSERFFVLTVFAFIVAFGGWILSISYRTLGT
jgi:hypothetical protein